jgi:hypothetical protein
MNVDPRSRSIVYLYPPRLLAQRVAHLIDIDRDELGSACGLALKRLEREDDRSDQLVAALIKRNLRLTSPSQWL